MRKISVVFFCLLSICLLGVDASAEVKSGSEAPDFLLKDTSGESHSLSDFKGQYVVLEWINHECPFVVKHYGSGNMQALQAKYTGKNVIWLSIASSAKGKQGNYTADQWNKATAEKKAFPTAVLIDEDGKVGKTYGAKTTPHMFVVDPTGKLIYQGAIDDIPSADPADIANAKNYVVNVLDAALAGEDIPVASSKSYGCSVKY